MPAQGQRRVAIVGAAGATSTTSTSVYRDDPSSEVIAFTGAQIPSITDRRWPACTTATVP